MSRRRRRRRKALLLIWLSGTLFGVVAQYAPRSTSIQDFFNRLTNGAENVIVTAAISSVVLFSIEALHRYVLPKFRRTPLLITAVSAAFFYLVAIVISVYGFVWVLSLLLNRSLSTANEQVVKMIVMPGNRQGIIYIFGIAVAITFILEFSRRIGPGRILNWLLGRYRNPREEQRVFLLIDLRNSTPIAEKLGALRFSYLLRDFFSDLSEPVIETGGEVVAFVGDEAILSWSLGDAVQDANALRCFVLFKEKISQAAHRYQTEYGLVPQFKGALHVGPIVATEVGDFRTEVVFHGDALNTVSRVLGECNALGAELLLTDDIAKHLTALDGVTLEPLGLVHLRGKSEPVGLHKAQF